LAACVTSARGVPCGGGRSRARAPTGAPGALRAGVGGKGRKCAPGGVLRAEAAEGESGTVSGMVAEHGDTVSVDFLVSSPEGEPIMGSHATGPLTFLCGVGTDVIGNPLFQVLDDAIAGMAVGDVKQLTMAPPARSEDNIFDVARRQPPGADELEIGDTVTWEGTPAVVVNLTDDVVTIDTNQMSATPVDTSGGGDPGLAGQALLFEIKCVGIDKGSVNTKAQAQRDADAESG